MFSIYFLVQTSKALVGAGIRRPRLGAFIPELRVLVYKRYTVHNDLIYKGTKNDWYT